MFDPAIVDHVLFLVFGLLFPLNAAIRSQPVMKAIDTWDTSMKLAFYRGNSAVLWLITVVVLIVWLLTGRPLASLGFSWPAPGSWGLSLLVCCLFLATYAFDAWLEVATPAAREKNRREWRENTPFLPGNQKELTAFYRLAVSAAVGEEILFRGYFLLYLMAIFGDGAAGKFTALLLVTLLFALSHFYQGWKAVIKIAVLSLAFGVLFLISGSLLLPVLLHLIIDIAGGWLGYYLLRKEGVD